MVIKRNVLVAIIGFMSGLILNLYLDLPMEFALYGGLTGYFMGLLLDHADTKQQIETYHFRTLNSTHQRFTIETHPHVALIYSARENETSVVMHFRISEKPEDFRLSVVKNLRDFQFGISERDTKTRISIELTYPEFNYPHHAHLHTPAYTEFLFDIQEKSLDFQAAIQKVVPGLTLNPDPQMAPSLQGHTDKERRTHNPPPPTPSPPSSPPLQSPPIWPERKIATAPPLQYEIAPSPSPSDRNGPNPLTRNSHENPLSSNDKVLNPFPHASGSQPSTVTEKMILDDLHGSPSQEAETTFPDLSDPEVTQLPDSNNRVFETFLGENTPQEAPPPNDEDHSPPTSSREKTPSESSPTRNDNPASDEPQIDFSAVETSTLPPDTKTVSERDRFNQTISGRFDKFHKKTD